MSCPMLKDCCLSAIRTEIQNPLCEWGCGELACLQNEWIQQIFGHATSSDDCNSFLDIHTLRYFLEANLEVFDLNNFDLKNINLNTLMQSKIMNSFRALRIIVLTNSGINNFGISYIVSNFSDSLTVINLSNSIQITHECFLHLSYLTQLHTIILENCGLAIDNWPFKQSFVEVNFGGNNIVRVAAISDLASTSANSLVRLNISSFQTFQCHAEECVLLAFKSLTKLIINLVTNVSSEFSILLNNMRQLTWLEMAGLSFYSNEINCLSSLHCLTRLNLSSLQTTLSNIDLRIICKLSQLKYLDLSYTKADLSVDTVHTKEYLFAELSYLKKLNLEHSLWQLPQKPTLNKDEVFIFPISLKELNIHSSPWATTYPYILASLKRLVSLRSLNISGIWMEPQQMSDLISYLTGITNLTAENSNLSFPTFLNFLRNLKTFPTYFVFNGVKYAADDLKGLRTLDRDLYGNNLSAQEGLSRLFHASKHPKATSLTNLTSTGSEAMKSRTTTSTLHSPVKLISPQRQVSTQRSQIKSISLEKSSSDYSQFDSSSAIVRDPFEGTHCDTQASKIAPLPNQHSGKCLCFAYKHRDCTFTATDGLTPVEITTPSLFDNELQSTSLRNSSNKSLNPVHICGATRTAIFAAKELPASQFPHPLIIPFPGVAGPKLSSQNIKTENLLEIVERNMKGFLTKVQNRSGTTPAPNGGSSKNGEGIPNQQSAEGKVPRSEATPRADIALPKKEKRRISFMKHKRIDIVKDLPLLADTPMVKRESLFRQKLQLCCAIFDFDDPESDDPKSKEIKRETLVEIAEYVNTPVGQKIYTEGLMPDVVDMVRINVFRPFAPPSDDFDPEEDEPAMEPSWPHLQIVYEFFLRFIVSSEVSGKVAKKYVDQNFIRQWIELFDAEDPRERDYVKTILHRMYGKFMSYRSYIRKAISQVFFRYIYETGRHNGVGELLEILGSIINGFAIPLKQEHLQFLERALLPLHKPRNVVMYHSQLSYCISQYVEKDPDTISIVLTGLIRYWPWMNPAKQVLYLNELEEILDLIRGEQITCVQADLYKLLASCISSEHFQVTERALYYWNSEHLCTNVLSQSRASVFLPYVIGPLSKVAQGHWNQTVESLAQSVLKMYMDMDPSLYEKCSREDQEKAASRVEQRMKAAAMWDQLAERAVEQGVSVPEPINLLKLPGVVVTDN